MEQSTNKLYVIMVGLPARGKSTLAKRIHSGLEQQGISTSIFNNGELRRKLFGVESVCPEFFNPCNTRTKQFRDQILDQSIFNAREWLINGGNVAIIDATNGTSSQRSHIMSTLQDHPLLFIECVNEDPILLAASIQRKTKLPEFLTSTEEEALHSFKKRLAYYESEYVPLSNEPCWIRVDAVDSHILNESPCNDLPYYAAIRDIVASKWVHDLFLVRHGETAYNLEGRIGGDPRLTGKGCDQAKKLAEHFSEVEIPYIFTSTKIRSIQTAQPFLDIHKKTICMQFAEFDEIDAGICDGMRYLDIRNGMPQVYNARSQNKYHYIYPKGESYALLKERVAQGLRRALFIAGEGTLMIVGHQAINRTLLSLFLFQRPDDVPYTYIPQNQYYHITVTQQKKLFEMIQYI